MRRYGTEFIAGAVVAWVACACVPLGALQAGLAVGGILAVVMIAGGGAAHVNPAVSAVVWVHGGISSRGLLCRVVAQIGGAAAAAAVARLTLAEPPVAPPPGAGVAALLVAEVVATFVLVYGVFEVLPGRPRSGRYGAGAVAGVAVMAGTVAISALAAAAGAPATGFNPATSVALAAFDASSWLMVLAAAPGHLVAAACAAALARPVVGIPAVLPVRPAVDNVMPVAADVRLPAPRRSAEDLRPVGTSA